MTSRRHRSPATTPDPRRADRGEHSTIPDLMARWACGYDAVWAAIRDRDLVATRIGSGWRVSPDAVIAYETSRSTAA